LERRATRNSKGLGEGFSTLARARAAGLYTASQQVGEPLIGFGIKTPNKRVPNEQHFSSTTNVASVMHKMMQADRRAWWTHSSVMGCFISRSAQGAARIGVVATALRE
jgi:hypothetical protein